MVFFFPFFFFFGYRGSPSHLNLGLTWLLRLRTPICESHLLTALSHSRGRFGEEFFTLSGTYFEGRPPKSVNLYWRRFRIDDIPLDDAESFDAWLLNRWYEKDALMETYATSGRFPPMAGASAPDEAKSDQTLQYIETEVRTKHWWEFLRIFVVVGIFALLGNIVTKIWYRLTHIIG